jgi:TonB family protein
MFSWVLVTILGLGLTQQSTTLLSIEEIQKQLTSELLGKVLTLRAFNKSSHVEFDETGQLKKQGEPGSWTVYSQLLVKKIDVTASRVHISGVRVIHHYDPKAKGLVASPSDMNLDVDIYIKKAADISAAFSKIFAGNEGLLPYVPSYWHQYLSGKKDETPPPNPSNVSQRVRVGGNIMGAKLIKQVVPKYSVEAKNFLLEGVVALSVEINETGNVENINIVGPAGAGFDENAVEAVSQWKYSPTLLDGKPVRVLTTITVNYKFSR